MTERAVPASSSRGYVTPPGPGYTSPSSLADVLERVLDKGIIIAGDIRVNLLDIELLTVKIRLLVVSVDKAAEMGIDWWRNDPMLSTSEQGLADENRRLRERLEELESGEGRETAEVRGFASLQVGIVGEGVADLLRLRQAELLCADCLDAERFDQGRYLAQFARIVGRNDQPVADRPHRPVAFSWAAKISEQPMRASRSSRSKPSSS